MKKVILLAGLFLSACSSSPKYQAEGPEVQPDVVLGRIDGLKDRPKDFSESRPFFIENGMVYSLGMTTLDGDARVEAGMRIAQNNAKSAISGAIEQRLDFILQNAEEGTGDQNQLRYIGAEASKLTTNYIT